MPSQARTTFDKHVAAVEAHDLDGILATFAPDAILADNDRIGQGRDYLRATYAAALDVSSRMQPESTIVEQGNVIYLTFRSRIPDGTEIVGTNTFVFDDDGLISVHTDFNTTLTSGAPTPLETLPTD